MIGLNLQRNVEMIPIGKKIILPNQGVWRGLQKNNMKLDLTKKTQTTNTIITLKIP
jgi:hypothetical protein